MKIDLLSKIEERSARIGVIGLGYVGLPLALRFCEENFKVIGFDSDPKKVLILGVAYKKDIDDMRESPSLKIMKLLLDKGAVIEYNDPYISSLPETRKYKFNMRSVELTENSIKNYDCLIIVTNHSSYNYKWILKDANLIVDTRNAIKEPSSKVVKA